MKRILIVAIIALVAITGTANATGSNILDETGNALPFVVELVPSSTTTYGLSIGNGLPEAGTEITYVITSSNPADLTINQLKAGAVLDGTDPFIDLEVFELTLSPSATGEYKVTVDTYEDGVLLSSDDFLASATQRFEAIPEFPTVALPVAAILGLAFLFQRRKEE